MEMEWESCGWWKWRRAAQRRASGSDPTPSDTLRRPDPLSSLRNRPPIVWFETVTFSHVNMQRFRPSVPKFGENKWKKNGREPMKLDKIYAPFRETYPMQIRNWVLGAGKNVKQSPCIPDMMTLFECLQKNEFHQSNCDKPLAVFQSCYSAHLASVKHQESAKNQAEPIPGARKLSTDQLNTLLRRYPHKLKKS